MPCPTDIRKIAIIGGGPGGLMTAYLLAKQAGFSAKITLYESSARLGGKMLTRAFANHAALYEAGAAELYDYSQLGPDPLRELVAELGLKTSPMESGGAIFGNQLVRHAADIRRVWGEATAAVLDEFSVLACSSIPPAEYYESDWRQDNKAPLARQTFQELVDRVPDQAARDYIRIMTHSDLACELHQTNAAYGLQNYLMDEPAYMRLYYINGGNERLVQELARRITADVRLEEPVTRVEHGLGTSYRVTSHCRGQPVAADFDFVVVALPNNWIPEVTWGGEILAAAMDEHHRFYDHPAHYLRVTARFDRPFWRSIIDGSYFMSDAFGGCCLYDEGTRTSAETGSCNLGWLIAGDAALNLGSHDDATIIEQVLASLPASLQPGRTLFREAQVQRWFNSVNALPGGFPAKEPDARHQPEPVQHPGLFVVGDYLFDSTLNGVLDSAATVAEWIHEDSQPDVATVLTRQQDPLCQ